MNSVHKAIARIHGLYAVTADTRDTGQLASAVAAALAGGAQIVQYRNKAADRLLATEQARALRDITNAGNALLIVNDDWELAVAVAADGVHLGRHDGGLADAMIGIGRIQPHGRQLLVGVSCYDSLALAREAMTAGADYIAFGSFFASSTKPHAVRAETSLIHEAKRISSLPVVAIGGITPENAPELITAGVDAIAVISALFDAPDVRKQAQRFTSLFNPDV